MRISRTTVILLVANLLAFGLVWKATYVHRPTTETPDLVFAAAGAKLELTDEGRTLTLERRNSVWRVTAPFDWPANLWTVQRLQDELRFIGADKGFPVEEAKANGEGLAAYGLATPRWTLKVTGEAGTVTEVKIGLMPSTRKCYLLTEDRRRIIPLPEAMTAALEIKPEAYRVDKVFEVTDFEARAVSVRRGPGEEVFSLVSETRARVGVTASGPEWRFEAPFDTLADAESAPKAVADLTNLRVLRFVNATEAETGLANPVLRIAIEGSARRQALLLGKPANEKGDQRFAKLEDNVALFVVDAPALQTCRSRCLACSRRARRRSTPRWSPASRFRMKVAPSPFAGSMRAPAARAGRSPWCRARRRPSAAKPIARRSVASSRTCRRCAPSCGPFPLRPLPVPRKSCSSPRPRPNRGKSSSSNLATTA